MIVLVGAVFATDEAKTAANGTAAINVTATIEAHAPRFALITASGVSSNVSDSVLATDTAQSFTATAATISTDLTSADGTVAFKIQQTAASNIKATYTITVTATPMNLVAYRNGNTTVAVSSIENYTQDTATEQFALSTDTAVDSTPTITASTPADASVLGLEAVNNVLTATFKGSAPLGNNDAAVDLGTFSVTWKKNPKAVAGNYSADIVMTVTSDN